MSLTTGTWERATIGAIPGTPVSGMLMVSAKLMHNLRAREFRGGAASYYSVKIASTKVALDDILHPKWEINDPDTYEHLFTTEKCRGTPNAWIDIHCEWLLLMTAQLLKYSFGRHGFYIAKDDSDKVIKPTGFRLGVILLVDIFMSTFLRAVALIAKIIIGVVMALAGVARLIGNLWPMIKAAWAGGPMPDGAKKALGWLVPFADAFVKPIIRFSIRHPIIAALVVIAAIVVIVGFTGGLGAPAALVLGKLAASAFGLKPVFSAIGSGFHTAFATNWLHIPVQQAYRLSGFVSSAIVALGTTLLGYAVRFRCNYIANKAAEKGIEQAREVKRVNFQARMLNDRREREEQRRRALEEIDSENPTANASQSPNVLMSVSNVHDDAAGIRPSTPSLGSGSSSPPTPDLPSGTSTQSFVDPAAGVWGPDSTSESPTPPLSGVASPTSIDTSSIAGGVNPNMGNVLLDMLSSGTERENTQLITTMSALDEAANTTEPSVNTGIRRSRSATGAFMNSLRMLIEISQHTNDLDNIIDNQSPTSLIPDNISHSPISTVIEMVDLHVPPHEALGNLTDRRNQRSILKEVIEDRTHHTDEGHPTVPTNTAQGSNNPSNNNNNNKNNRLGHI